MDLDAVKRHYGVPPATRLLSHRGGGRLRGRRAVPAAAVKRLLKERPALTGVAVPGMPPGSPGMESPQRWAYRSVGFDRDGRMQVFQEHAP